MYYCVHIAAKKLPKNDNNQGSVIKPSGAEPSQTTNNCCKWCHFVGVCATSCASIINKIIWILENFISKNNNNKSVAFLSLQKMKFPTRDLKSLC